MGIYKSAVLERPVEFPLAASDAFYHKETMTAAMPKYHEKKKDVDNLQYLEDNAGQKSGQITWPKFSRFSP